MRVRQGRGKQERRVGKGKAGRKVSEGKAKRQTWRGEDRSEEGVREPKKTAEGKGG